MSPATVLRFTEKKGERSESWKSDVFKPLVKLMIKEMINISLIKILSMYYKFNFQKLCLQNHNVSSKTFPNIIADM